MHCFPRNPLSLETKTSGKEIANSRRVLFPRADARLLHFCLLFSLQDREEDGLLLLGICMLVLTFLPASNLLVTVGFVVAERVLYLPRYVRHFSSPIPDLQSRVCVCALADRHRLRRWIDAASSLDTSTLPLRRHTFLSSSTCSAGVSICLPCRPPLAPHFPNASSVALVLHPAYTRLLTTHKHAHAHKHGQKRGA